jgi:hypothetical protein
MIVSHAVVAHHASTPSQQPLRAPVPVSWEACALRTDVQRIVHVALRTVSRDSRCAPFIQWQGPAGVVAWRCSTCSERAFVERDAVKHPFPALSSLRSFYSILCQAAPLPASSMMRPVSVFVSAQVLGMSRPLQEPWLSQY